VTGPDGGAGRPAAVRVLEQIDRSTTTIVRATPADQRRAREIIAKYQDKDFSLTDAISFVVVERLQITKACGFDHRFAQYGSTVVES
jgi:uncharacterized protein